MFSQFMSIPANTPEGVWPRRRSPNRNRLPLFWKRGRKRGLTPFPAEIHGQYRKTLQLLELNPYHPSLRLHSLQGRMRGLSSVAINISHRIVIELIIEADEILLVNIGKHDQVY